MILFLLSLFLFLLPSERVQFYFLLSASFSPAQTLLFSENSRRSTLAAVFDGRYEDRKVVADPIVATWSDSRFSITPAPCFSVRLPFRHGQRSRSKRRVFRRRCTTFHLPALCESFVHSRAHENGWGICAACSFDQSTRREHSLCYLNAIWTIESWDRDIGTANSIRSRSYAIWAGIIIFTHLLVCLSQHQSHCSLYNRNSHNSRKGIWR